MERRAPVEIREAEGGPNLYGVLIQEGRPARRRREVFAPGAVEWPADGVGILTRHHAAPEVWAVPKRQADGRITLRARATERIREAVEAGRRYMSVEFHALRDRRTEGGIREVLRAFVPDVALVASPEYGQAVAEVRQAPGDVALRGSLPLGQSVSCRCGTGERAGCVTVRIDPAAFDAVLAEVAAEERAISLFVTGGFDRPLASTLGGGLAVAVEGGALTWSVAGLPDSGAARDLLAGLEATPELYRTRAYWPQGPDAGEVARREGDEWVVERADLRGIEVAPIAGPLAGLEPVQLARRADPEPENREEVRVWL